MALGDRPFASMMRSRSRTWSAGDGHCSPHEVLSGLGATPTDFGPRMLAAATLAMTFELWGHKHVSNPQIEEAHISDHPDLIPEVVRLLREMQKLLPTPESATI